MMVVTFFTVRSTGVVVKTIVAGGVADRDGRLQSGDHILQIGDVNLRGMSSDQVAIVLRQAGAHVRLVVARPVDPSASPELFNMPNAPVIATKLLYDAEEIERAFQAAAAMPLVESMDEEYDAQIEVPDIYAVGVGEMNGVHVPNLV